MRQPPGHLARRTLGRRGDVRRDALAETAQSSPELGAKHTHRGMALDRSMVLLALLGAFALGVVAALVIFLRWERQQMARSGKARAWLVLRLATIPIAALSIAAIWLPTQSVGGMEGLAVFYLLLFTAAPLVWFGLHWLVGRVARPQLTAGESLQMALFLPAFAIAASIVAHQLQPVAWAIARSAESASYAMAEETPAHHELVSARRWATPAGDVLVARWQAPPDVRVERIDLLEGATLLQNAGRSQIHRLCRTPDSIVLLRAAGAPAPTLRVYWRDAGTRLRVSTLTPPDTADATPFAVTWRDTSGFDLPEPLPRQSVWLAHATDPEGSFFSSEAQMYEAGDDPALNCLRPGWQGRFPLAGLRVRVESPRGGEPLWLEALRPSAAPTTDRSS